MLKLKNLSIIFIMFFSITFIGQVSANEIVDFQNTNTIKYNELTAHDKKQVDCLAKNIYFESAKEGLAGWMAVGFVTMNRVFSGNYPETVCGVVYQKIRSTYQFSWVKFNDSVKIKMPSLYNEILEVATELYQSYGTSLDITGGALFFHSTSVNPRWTGIIRTKKIGNHIFYRRSN